MRIRIIQILSPTLNIRVFGRLAEKGILLFSEFCLVWTIWQFRKVVRLPAEPPSLEAAQNQRVEGATPTRRARTVSAFSLRSQFQSENALHH
jgi:hypothetical protein